MILSGTDDRAEPSLRGPQAAAKGLACTKNMYKSQARGACRFELLTPSTHSRARPRIKAIPHDCQAGLRQRVVIAWPCLFATLLDRGLNPPPHLM